MTINFPKGIKIDLNNIPDDFEQQIQAAFAKYTTGTSEDFTYQDKLAFIDQIIQKLHKANDSWDAVRDLLIERFEYHLDDYGELPDGEDFESMGFIQSCYERGRNDARLYYQFEDDKGKKDHHIYDKIMGLEYRAIKAVIEWRKP